MVDALRSPGGQEDKVSLLPCHHQPLGRMCLRERRDRSAISSGAHFPQACSYRCSWGGAPEVEAVGGECMGGCETEAEAADRTNNSLPIIKLSGERALDVIASSIQLDETCFGC
ncbi:hypothetical protein J4Q44_G00288690 [Coregonus suidteri]|uniref:Uncharacterized protein n=1 Tax=Coregonus suidteri TaxID=861788 RepID=A0AAN8QJ43_9TELE